MLLLFVPIVEPGAFVHLLCELGQLNTHLSDEELSCSFSLL